MSEMELSVFRQRSIEAMKQKARRGELFLTVAVGYVKAGAREALRSIGQENLTSPRIPRTARLGYRRKGAEPWLMTVASPSGFTAMSPIWLSPGSSGFVDQQSADKADKFL
jgi:hypothetical protein